jgi:hypothetical protein
MYMYETDLSQDCLSNDYTTFLGTIGYKYADLLWYISNDIKLTYAEKNKILEMYREWCDNYRNDLVLESSNTGKTIMNLSDIYWVYRGMSKLIYTFDKFDTYRHIKIVSEKIVELTKKDNIDKDILDIISVLNTYLYKWLIDDGDLDKLMALFTNE